MALKGAHFYIIGVYGPNEDAAQDEKDTFFDEVRDLAMRKARNEELNILGDLNGRVASKTQSLTTGDHGDVVQNDNGSRIENMAETLNCHILNTYFAHKEIHRYTWT